MSINRQTGKEDAVRIYNGIVLSHKNEIVSFTDTWTDLETVQQSEADEREKNKCHLSRLICGI